MVTGQTMEGSGHGPLTYPTVLPFEPESTIEPGTLSTLGSNGREKLTPQKDDGMMVAIGHVVYLFVCFFVRREHKKLGREQNCECTLELIGRPLPKQKVIFWQ